MYDPADQFGLFFERNDIIGIDESIYIFRVNRCGSLWFFESPGKESCEWCIDPYGNRGFHAAGNTATLSDTAIWGVGRYIEGYSRPNSRFSMDGRKRTKI